MSNFPTQLTLITLGLLAYALILSTLRVLSARVSLSIARHNLVAESKRQRMAFFRELAARNQPAEEVDDDEPYNVDIVEPEPIDFAESQTLEESLPQAA